MSAIDWERLRELARDVMTQAYAPYSRYPVGAAAVVDDGRIVRGCNVENASFGLTLCAECGLVSDLFASGGGLLEALVCVNAQGESILPCGRCRQVLHEFASRGMLVDSPDGPLLLSDLLPRAFGPDHLA